jgi:hypothetical protein
VFMSWYASMVLRSMGNCAAYLSKNRSISNWLKEQCQTGTSPLACKLPASHPKG